jgi:hypothetical protein
MKKLQIITICVSLIMLTACRREDSVDTNQAAKALLLGKWQLNNLVDDYYEPVNVLKDHYETPGTPGDSVIFKSDNQMFSYIDVSPGEEKDIYPYEWINDSIIKVDGEQYTIRKLTPSELTLYNEVPKNNGRDVEIAYFIR